MQTSWYIVTKCVKMGLKCINLWWCKQWLSNLVKTWQKQTLLRGVFRWVMTHKLHSHKVCFSLWSDWAWQSVRMCWYYLCDYYEVCNEEVKTRSCHTEQSQRWSEAACQVLLLHLQRLLKAVNSIIILRKLSPLWETQLWGMLRWFGLSQSHYCNNKVRKTVIDIIWIKPNLWMFGTTWCLFFVSSEGF